MFSIIRLVIGGAFYGCSIVGINKLKVGSKRVLYIVFALITVALIGLLAFLPFENLFITFDSPEKSYEYYNLGKSDVSLVVEGDNCDFVVEQDGGSKSYLIIPKTDEGWKLGIGINTKRIAQKIDNGVAVYVYRYKQTNDYFITVFDTNGGESTVKDNYNSEFLSLEKYDETVEKKFVTYYAHVSNPDSQYSVTVNGNEIELEIG